MACVHQLTSSRGRYSLLVQVRIHWQAVLLLTKGMKFHSNTTCPLASSAGCDQLQGNPDHLCRLHPHLTSILTLCVRA
jgi:hypothetical protein